MTSLIIMFAILLITAVVILNTLKKKRKKIFHQKLFQKQLNMVQIEDIYQEKS